MIPPVGSIAPSTLTEATGIQPARQAPASETGEEELKPVEIKDRTRAPDLRDLMQGTEKTDRAGTKTELPKVVISADPGLQKAGAPSLPDPAPQLAEGLRGVDTGLTTAAAKTETAIQTALPPAQADAAKQVAAAIRTERTPGGGGIEVRLDPPELGRVRIHFSMERGDAVVATVSADRPETLDIMRRHAGDLIEELREAGFASVELDFSQMSEQEQNDADGSPESVTEAKSDIAPDDDTAVVYVNARSDQLLDRRV